jgi:hypothetical protein
MTIWRLREMGMTDGIAQTKSQERGCCGEKSRSDTIAHTTGQLAMAIE